MFIDAHPSRYSSNDPQHGWIGSYVNEPSFNETANAFIDCSESSTKKTIRYPTIQHDHSAFIQLAVDVHCGEEITAIYGYSNTARRRLGYEVGKDCFENLPETPKPKLYFGKYKNLTEKKLKSCRRNIKKFNCNRRKKQKIET